MHDEPEYDAYYNTYVEVPTSFAADKDNSLFITPTKNNNNPNANVALTPNNANPCNKIISPIYQQPPKQYQHQYTKSSPVLMSPPTPTTTKRTTTPTPPTPLSPQNVVALQQSDFDDIPPPLPPPNPNHPSHHNHQHQLSLPLRYQQQLPTPNSNNNHMPSSQQLQQLQQQQQQQHHNNHNQHQQQYQEQLQQLDYNNGEALYGTNSPTVSSTKQ